MPGKLWPLWICYLFILGLLCPLAYGKEDQWSKSDAPHKQLDFSALDVRYLIAERGEHRVSELIKSNFAGFQPLVNPDQNFGYSNKDFWILLVIPKYGDEARLYLEVAYPLLDKVDAYFINDNQTIDVKYRTGDHRNFSSRPINTTNFVFPVDFPSDKSRGTILLRIQSSGSVFVPIRVWKPENYLADKSSLMLMQGLFFGAILAVLLYNFFICILTRSATYFFYIGLVFSIANVYLALRGYTFQFIFPDSPHRVDISIMVAAASSEGFIVAFSAHFLKLYKSSRKFYRFAVVLSAFYFFLALLGFFMPYGQFVKIVVLMAPFSVLFSMTMGIRSLFLGRREAYYYVAAWTIFIFGTVLYSLANFGIIPSTPLTIHSMQLGSAFEIMFLSFALGARLNNLQVQNKNLISQLRQYINKIELIVAEKTASLQSIMNHIKLGIFTIRMPQFTFGEEHSKHMRVIFGYEPQESDNALDFMFKNSDVNRDAKAAVEQASYAMFMEDPLAFELNQHCFPKEIKLDNSHNETKFLELDWNPMFNDKGQTDRILVTCKDVTDLKVFRQKAVERLKDLDCIAELLAVSSDKMRSFFDIYDEVMEEIAESLVLHSRWNDEDRRNFLIEVHTFKGASRSLGLRDLAEKIHDLESLFQTSKSHPEPDLNSIKLAFDETLGSYQKYRSFNYQTLNRKKVGTDLIEVHRQHLQEDLEVLQNLRLLKLPSEAQLKIDKFSERIKNRIFVSTERLFQEVIDPLTRISKELNKPMPHILGSREHLHIHFHEATALRQAFVHLLRNAMDHGIELPQQRIAAGKDPAGTIYIDLQTQLEMIEIRVYDDGQGLNLARVLEKAREANLLANNQTPSPEQIAEFIFHPGLTTRHHVSMTSGRGVGMDAVRKHLEDIGGTISIVLLQSKDTNFYPCQFRIRMPMSIERSKQSEQASSA